MPFCKVIIANIMYIVETFIKGTCWGGGGGGFKESCLAYLCCHFCMATQETARNLVCYNFNFSHDTLK